jgi:hypothetical protein
LYGGEEDDFQAYTIRLPNVPLHDRIPYRLFSPYSPGLFNIQDMMVTISPLRFDFSEGDFFQEFGQPTFDTAGQIVWDLTECDCMDEQIDGNNKSLP